MVKTPSVLERSISQSLENEHEESLTLVAAPELEGSHPDCAAALSRVGDSRSLTVYAVIAVLSNGRSGQQSAASAASGFVASAASVGDQLAH